MSPLVLHTGTVSRQMPAGPAVENITDHLQELVAESRVRRGQLTATAVGSTGSLTTIEFEPGAVADLERAIAELTPPERSYAHEQTWHDGNGHSHVQAALLGPSVALPVRDGKLALGTWQQVVLINHDVRSRRRAVEVTLIGE